MLNEFGWIAFLLACVFGLLLLLKYVLGHRDKHLAYDLVIFAYVVVCENGIKLLGKGSDCWPAYPKDCIIQKELAFSFYALAMLVCFILALWNQKRAEENTSDSHRFYKWTRCLAVVALLFFVLSRIFFDPHHSANTAHKNNNQSPANSLPSIE